MSSLTVPKTFPSSANTAWSLLMKAVVGLVLYSLHMLPLSFLGAPMHKHVCASVCVRQMLVHVCVRLMAGFVFRALWGQTGSAELTMHPLVCNQPEISSKQTQSC